MTALLHALLWACPRLERLDRHFPNLYEDDDEDTALAMKGMVTAANERRCEEAGQLTASFSIEDFDFRGVP